MCFASLGTMKTSGLKRCASVCRTSTRALVPRNTAKWVSPPPGGVSRFQRMFSLVWTPRICHEPFAVKGMNNNHDEVLFPFMRLDVYRVARELAVRVETAKIGDRELRDQATRAAKSVLLRLSEGLPHYGQGLRRKYFAEAQGSLHEVAAAMDVAAVLGFVDTEVAREALALGLRVRRMMGRLQK